MDIRVSIKSTNMYVYYCIYFVFYEYLVGHRVRYNWWSIKSYYLPNSLLDKGLSLNIPMDINYELYQTFPLFNIFRI